MSRVVLRTTVTVGVALILLGAIWPSSAPAKIRAVAAFNGGAGATGGDFVEGQHLRGRKESTRF
jgi:hypothetical protein